MSTTDIFQLDSFESKIEMHVSSLCEKLSRKMSLIMEEAFQNLRSEIARPLKIETLPILETPEQAHAGYKEIREMPAISDLPRIMPGYQDSLAIADCHTEDNRETFLCHSIQTDSNSGIQVQHMPTVVKIKSQSYSLDWETRNDRQTNDRENFPCHTSDHQSHDDLQTDSGTQIQQSYNGSPMFNSHQSPSLDKESGNSYNATDLSNQQSECVHLLKPSLSDFDLLNKMTDSQCKDHKATSSCLSSYKFFHVNDTFSSCIATLCQHGPGPKPPDLHCCYPKKSRYKD